MRIYIIEDDVGVISILEDIVEREQLGTLCGDTGEEEPDLEEILAIDPDIILIDLLMPGKDGIQVVRELKEMGCNAKFIMISQVSSKEMIAKAYTAGVEFFIQKPVNVIEVQNVIRNVASQLQNERALKTIQSVFTLQTAPAAPEKKDERHRRRIKYILSELGMAGEKGAQDITQMCLYLLKEHRTASQMGMSTLCATLSDSPRTMEQRCRRAVERGLSHIASLGLEDYNNEAFSRYASRLFPFVEVRREMSYHQGKGAGGKVNLKVFLDGMLVLIEEE